MPLSKLSTESETRALAAQNERMAALEDMAAPVPMHLTLLYSTPQSLLVLLLVLFGALQSLLVHCRVIQTLK
jgi:hypothetical protein